MNMPISDGINELVQILKQDQKHDGTWEYPFEVGISTDCYMIILLKTLEINDEKLILDLTKRILSRQEKTGAWKLYYDEEGGNLTSTLEAYYALLYSGYYQKTDERLRAAKKFILKNGGIEEAHMFIKILLALTGQINWPRLFPVPLEMILLPLSFPVNFYSFSEFGRANLAPIMILADRKFQRKTADSPDISDLFHKRGTEFDRDLDAFRSIFSILENGIKSLIGLPSQIHKLATEQTKQYMLDRIEPDGTLLGYFSSTFLMIFALLSLGYSKTNSVIINAVNGLKQMKCEINGLPHIQYTTATVWNTSLINYALQEAGMSPTDETIKKANHSLLKRQQYKYGDWVIHNPTGIPGGWGFGDINTKHPDIDDTTASLRAIARNVITDPSYRHSWDRGMNWLLSMQNDDGGWPAFEKNANSKLLQLLPIEKAEFILADPSSADLTGRTLEFLGNFTNLPKNHSAIKSGRNWLFKNQEKDGSWYGRWGICYIYGTWAALTGLRAVNVLPDHRAMEKGVIWLKDIQNPDGGWGESCKSDSAKKYIPLNASTLTHTAWAVDALISVYERPTKEINEGIQFLLGHLEKKDWTTEYPKGQGMAGDFYMHYHSYRYIFPLLAFAHYREKFT
ncbi:squalene--hopene cyclase [Cytobacillus depressus]|uniref:Squalene--hopene cyclase n=1 Tax=Cytobacillus depressus TaxID=1602942 RepID=A0A6L3V274_9BACI|nr:prenyltransferase/squalene oxidase repeat-containing protein [Cytobacillus depressus]KAB2330161.1 squalene--hopene cyclase [Cytobacillus depressus]